MKDIKVFVDSGVVVSSLLSKTGAAHLLINSNFPIKKYISNLSIKELEKVIVKLNIKQERLQKTIDKLDKVVLNKSSTKKAEIWCNHHNTRKFSAILKRAKS